jgi:hypothetical protein
MNIINISSEIRPSSMQVKYFKELLSVRNSFHFGYVSLFCISKNIPIFLVNENDFDKNNSRKGKDREYEYEKNDDTNPPTEWLGYYTRAKFGLFSNTPIIVICPERIKKCSINRDEFTWLFAKVLIHELCHAVMDHRAENVKYGKCDDFFRWMEESTANMETLTIFEDKLHNNYYHRECNNRDMSTNSFDDDAFEFVKCFMKKQPPEYAFGCYQYEERVQYYYWYQDKDNELVSGKKQKEKKTFMDYVINNIGKWDKTKLKEIYDVLDA